MCETTKNRKKLIQKLSNNQLEAIKEKLLFYAVIEYERYRKRCKMQ